MPTFQRGGGVRRLLPGTNITLDPAVGVGVVTITSTGGASATPIIQIGTIFGDTGYEIGTGYVSTNYELMLLFQTDVAANGYYYRQFNTQFVGLNHEIDIESAIDTEFLYTDEDVYWQMYVVLGDANYGLAPETYDAAGTWKFAGFYYVRSPEYDQHLLAVTRDDTGSEITDVGYMAVGSLFTLLKIEYREDSVKYYLNNVLVATHTTHIMWCAEPSMSKIGVSSQTEGYDEGAAFYFWRFTEWT